MFHESLLRPFGDLRLPTEFAGTVNGNFDGLQRSISIED